MNTLKIKVENIKCGGCANSISNKLKGNNPNIQVDIDIEQGIVAINSSEELNRDSFIQTLKNMGYPEPGDGNLLTTAQSYVSCMVGRIQK